MHNFFNSGWSILMASLLAVLIIWQGLWAATRIASSWITARRGRAHAGRNLYSSKPLRATLRESYPRSYRFAAKRFDPQVFNGLPLTMITALYTLVMVASLVQALFAADGLVRIDEALNDIVAPYRIKPLVRLFIWVTDLGASPTLIAAAVVATGFLWVQRRPQIIAPLWVTIAGSQATSWIGKFYFQRERPEFVLDVMALSPSFPSGHATGAMAIYGFIAYAIARDLVGLRRRYEVVFWTAVLIALLGFSRVFLSVHFATDVAAGWLVGGFWLLVGVIIAEHRRPRHREPHAPPRHESQA